VIQVLSQVVGFGGKYSTAGNNLQFSSLFKEKIVKTPPPPFFKKAMSKYLVLNSG